MNILDFAKGVERLVDPMEVWKVLYMQTLSDSSGQRTHCGSEEKLRAAVEKVNFRKIRTLGEK